MKIAILGKNGLTLIDLDRRKAIRERCLNCSSWIPKEASNCSFHNCPLYPYRMAKGKQNAKARRKAIRKYCLWCMSGKPSDIRNGDFFIGLDRDRIFFIAWFKVERWCNQTESSPCAEAISLFSPIGYIPAERLVTPWIPETIFDG